MYSLSVGAAKMRLVMLAGIGLTGLAATAGAAPITFTSSGAFSNITNCSAASPCAISSGSGGTNNVLNLSGSNNGTLTASNLRFTGNTPLNDVSIGSLTWRNRNASGFDTNFGMTYTLTINFTAPNRDVASEAFSSTVAQASGTTADTISGFAVSAAALPGTINLPGVTVSDIHFLISGSGSFSGRTWSLPPCGRGTNGNCTATSSLLLVADFAPAAAVPEPMTLSLFGAGVVGLVLVSRRRSSQ